MKKSDLSCFDAEEGKNEAPGATGVKHRGRRGEREERRFCYCYILKIVKIFRIEKRRDRGDDQKRKGIGLSAYFS